jgi:hypothetical protein
MIIHVVPDNDEHPHILETFCECNPTIETECPETGIKYKNTLCAHNAYDGREAAEAVTKESLDVDKTWSTFTVE